MKKSEFPTAAPVKPLIKATAEIDLNKEELINYAIAKMNLSPNFVVDFAESSVICDEDDLVVPITIVLHGTVK